MKSVAPSAKSIVTAGSWPGSSNRNYTKWPGPDDSGRTVRRSLVPDKSTIVVLHMAPVLGQAFVIYHMISIDIEDNPEQ